MPGVIAALIARLLGRGDAGDVVEVAGDTRRELQDAADDRRARFPEAEALKLEHRLSTSHGGRRRTRAERDVEGQARADAIRDGSAVPSNDTHPAEE